MLSYPVVKSCRPPSEFSPHNWVSRFWTGFFNRTVRAEYERNSRLALRAEHLGEQALPDRRLAAGYQDRHHRRPQALLGDLVGHEAAPAFAARAAALAGSLEGCKIGCPVLDTSRHENLAKFETAASLQVVNCSQLRLEHDARVTSSPDRQGVGAKAPTCTARCQLKHCPRTFFIRPASSDKAPRAQSVHRTSGQRSTASSDQRPAPDKTGRGRLCKAWPVKADHRSATIAATRRIATQRI
jgi:hypothetical protein